MQRNLLEVGRLSRHIDSGEIELKWSLRPDVGCLSAACTLLVLRLKCRWRFRNAD